jgi:hypothetical protein
MPIIRSRKVLCRDFGHLSMGNVRGAYIWMRISTNWWEKYFGGIDFHPLAQTDEYLREYIDNYLDDMPDTEAETSKFYDLKQYFSQKFWFKKKGYDFYNNFYSTAEEYLVRYKLLLEEMEPTHSMLGLHKKYDLHMGDHDPAHGILKAYFSEKFADFYIRKFLFNLMDEDL